MAAFQHCPHSSRHIFGIFRFYGNSPGILGKSIYDGEKEMMTLIDFGIRRHINQMCLPRLMETANLNATSRIPTSCRSVKFLHDLTLFLIHLAEEVDEDRLKIYLTGQSVLDAPREIS